MPKVAKGCGHNHFGEPAWPNEILCVFPVVIAGVSKSTLGLASCEPSHGLSLSNPFQTPVEIVPEWYFVPTFNVLRTLEDKGVGVLSLLTLPLGLILTAPVENSVPWQNPLRRVVAMSNTLSFLGVVRVAAAGAAASTRAALPWS
jgi:cytochrome b6-f complex subunit 4